MCVHLEAALAEEQVQKRALQKQVDDAAGPNNSAKMIPRPGGTAGSNFSIQESMGLAGSTKKYETYKAIQVCRSTPA
jgi:hypothetical protein